MPTIDTSFLGNRSPCIGHGPQSELDEIIAAQPFLKGLQAQYLPPFFKAATYQLLRIDSLMQLLEFYIDPWASTHPERSFYPEPGREFSPGTVYTRGSSGDSPYHWRGWFARPGSAKLLLSRGAWVSCRNFA